MRARIISLVHVVVGDCLWPRVRMLQRARVCTALILHYYQSTADKKGGEINSTAHRTRILISIDRYLSPFTFIPSTDHSITYPSLYDSERNSKIRCGFSIFLNPLFEALRTAISTNDTGNWEWPGFTFSSSLKVCVCANGHSLQF